MKFVSNRSFIVVKPKKPLVDWVNGYDEVIIPVDDILSSRTLYMVGEIEDDSPSEVELFLKNVYEDIFTHELWAWYEDENYLPKNLSFELFKEWFEYEYVEMCFDTLNSKIVLE